jgi:hypothetical protein
VPRIDATTAPPAVDPLDALLERAEQTTVDGDIREWLTALRNGDAGNGVTKKGTAPVATQPTNENKSFAIA